MARGAVTIIGAGVAALVAALTLFPLGAVFFRAGTWPAFANGDWDAVAFTVTQSFLSALVSCILAVPVARALARSRFPGRSVLIVLMGAPFILPVIVAVLGLVAVFGRSGIVNDLLVIFGLPKVSIYGLWGVVLAHVFLNLPLAVRMLLHGWQTIPADRFRLAVSLGFGPRDLSRHLEWPMLRMVLPGIFVVIFVICLTSFAVALTLGGGPAATTVELAIYQAVKFDFDLGRAALLAATQFAIGIGAALLVFRWAAPPAFGAALDRELIIPRATGWRLWGDVTAISLAALFLILPLASIVLRGVPGLSQLPEQVWMALVRSTGIAVLSCILTTIAALMLSLAVASRQKPGGLIEISGVMPLATSGLVLGVGLFLLVQPFLLPGAVAVPVTLMVNTLLSLPFVYRILLPEARLLIADYARLSAALGIGGWAWLRWVALPRLARPLGFGAGIAAAFSMGDLGVITLFASDGTATLPLVVQRLMSAYRMDQAMAAALLLVASSFALFLIFDALGRCHADA